MKKDPIRIQAEKIFDKKVKDLEKNPEQLQKANDLIMKAVMTLLTQDKEHLKVITDFQDILLFGLRINSIKSDLQKNFSKTFNYASEYIGKNYFNKCNIKEMCQFKAEETVTEIFSNFLITGSILTKENKKDPIFLSHLLMSNVIFALVKENLEDVIDISEKTFQDRANEMFDKL